MDIQKKTEQLKQALESERTWLIEGLKEGDQRGWGVT